MTLLSGKTNPSTKSLRDKSPDIKHNTQNNGMSIFKLYHDLLWLDACSISLSHEKQMIGDSDQRGCRQQDMWNRGGKKTTHLKHLQQMQRVRQVERAPEAGRAAPGPRHHWGQLQPLVFLCCSCEEKRWQLQILHRLPKLNAATIKDSYPLPHPADTLDSLSGSCWFSTMDLPSGYWQVELEPQDREKTVFSTGSALYQFKVMPMQLTNAPPTFQRFMELVLHGLHWKECLIYLDDVLVFSRSFSDHLQSLEQIFSRFCSAGLKLKARKCQLARTQVTFMDMLSPTMDSNQMQGTLKRCVDGLHPEQPQRWELSLECAPTTVDLSRIFLL